MMWLVAGLYSRFHPNGSWRRPRLRNLRPRLRTQRKRCQSGRVGRRPGFSSSRHKCAAWRPLTRRRQDHWKLHSRWNPCFRKQARGPRSCLCIGDMFPSRLRNLRRTVHGCKVAALCWRGARSKCNRMLLLPLLLPSSFAEQI